jgi:predicted O-methyltransferase YrrM
MLNRTAMTPALYDYLLRSSVREPDAVRRLREQTEQMPESEMLVPPEEGQFLHLLVTLIGAKKALEVDRVQRALDRPGAAGRRLPGWVRR